MDDLLFVTFGLVHDNEPVLVIATGEERGHLSGRAIAAAVAVVERRVISRPIYATPDLVH